MIGWQPLIVNHETLAANIIMGWGGWWLITRLVPTIRLSRRESVLIGDLQTSALVYVLLQANSRDSQWVEDSFGSRRPTVGHGDSLWVMSTHGGSC